MFLERSEGSARRVAELVSSACRRGGDARGQVLAQAVNPFIVEDDASVRDDQVHEAMQRVDGRAVFVVVLKLFGLVPFVLRPRGADDVAVLPGVGAGNILADLLLAGEVAPGLFFDALQQAVFPGVDEGLGRNQHAVVILYRSFAAGKQSFGVVGQGPAEIRVAVADDAADTAVFIIVEGVETVIIVVLHAFKTVTFPGELVRQVAGVVLFHHDCPFFRDGIQRFRLEGSGLVDVRDLLIGERTGITFPAFLVAGSEHKHCQGQRDGSNSSVIHRIDV